MKRGMFVPVFDELADPRVVAELAAEAEKAGWDGFFVWDHVDYRAPVEAVADPWVTLAAIACATSSIVLGPMVTPLARRRPVVVAREVGTLDVLSQGRLVLGVGLGGDDYGEFTKTGEQADDKLRAQQLDEALEVLAQAATGEPVHHRGEHYLVDGIRFLPRPRVPVWVAVRQGNAAPLRRAARHQGVFPIGVETPAQLAAIVAELPTGPGYDVAVGGPPGTSEAGFAEAGATWWMTSMPITSTVADVRAALAGA